MSVGTVFETNADVEETSVVDELVSLFAHLVLSELEGAGAAIELTLEPSSDSCHAVSHLFSDLCSHQGLQGLATRDKDLMEMALF